MRTIIIARLWLPVLCCLLILSGCAGKQPKTLPLGPVEEQEAGALWSGFLASKRPPALDADIRLGWDVLGSKGGVSATVQLQQPALLHFAANDPLGRSLILAVADATSFTMVDNRIGHVYRGRTDSKFWHSYVPKSVEPQDLFFFLGGFIPEGEAQQVTLEQDVEKKGFWYHWQDKQSMRHYAFLDRRSGELQQRLLFDAQGDSVLELRYSDYRRDPASGYVWPGHLRITGEAVTGTLTVQVEKIYSHTPQGAAAFRLVPPPHFSVEQVP
jgi:hypothetical protein